MTREQLLSLMNKHFTDKQMENDRLIFNNISPLDLIEFIYDAEEKIQIVFPTETIRSENFKDLDSIYSLVSTLLQQ